MAAAIVIVFNQAVVSQPYIEALISKDGALVLASLDTSHYSDITYSIKVKYNGSRRFQPGSLLKPLAAIYLMKEINIPYSHRENCRGWESAHFHGLAHACWTSKGHGVLTMPQALAHSCNYYFFKQLETVNRDDYFQSITDQWGLSPGLKGRYLDSMIGNRIEEGLSVVQILQLYTRLASYLFSNPLAHENLAILEGLSGRIGTMAALRRQWRDPLAPSVLIAKSGTGFSGNRRANQTGTVVVFFRFTQSGKIYALVLNVPGLMGTQVGKDVLPKIVSELAKRGFIE